MKSDLIGMVYLLLNEFSGSLMGMRQNTTLVRKLSESFFTNSTKRNRITEIENRKVISLVNEKRTRFLKHLVEFRSFHAYENATEITQPYSRRLHYVAAAD